MYLHMSSLLIVDKFVLQNLVDFTCQHLNIADMAFGIEICIFEFM